MLLSHMTDNALPVRHIRTSDGGGTYSPEAAAAILAAFVDRSCIASCSGIGRHDERSIQVTPGRAATSKPGVTDDTSAMIYLEA
jgi:hypothetical protein